MRKAAKSQTVVPAGMRIVGLNVWKPKAGETLHGEFLGVKIRKSHQKGKDGKAEFKSYEIAQKVTGEIVAVSGAALERPFDTIKPGTEVFIVYRGIEVSANRRKFHAFDVYQKDSKSK